jgi:AcrR family transcriptional regulator
MNRAERTAEVAGGDVRKVTRRRGDVLTNAIYRAVLDELARTSFEELAFDKIASAAGTGKAALYRRWSTPAELVLAALTDPEAGFGETAAQPHTGTLRGDLIALLEHLARSLDQPRGRALRPLIAHRHRHPQLFEQVRRQVIRPHQEVLLRVLREAADRGEVAPERVTPRAASVGPRLIVFESWERDQVAGAEIEAIVDEVLIPMVSPHR